MNRNIMPINEHTHREIELISPDRELTDEEQKYRDIFLDCINDGDIVPFPSERFIQCIDERSDKRYYQPYWFLSSGGYLFSVHSGHIHIIKPNLSVGGKKRKNGTEDNTRWTEITKQYYPTWRECIERGYIPQTYFYRKTKNSPKIPMQRIVLFYFGTEEDRQMIIEDDPLIKKCHLIHHMYTMDWNESPYYNNNINSIQILRQGLEREHSYLHEFAKKTDTAYYDNAYYDSAVGEIPNYACDLWNILKRALETNDTAYLSAKKEDGTSFKNVVLHKDRMSVPEDAENTEDDTAV